MKYTFKEFDRQFPDDSACLDYIFNDKYGKLETCPKCNKEARFKRVYGRKSYQCQHTGCQYQLYPMAGTIFQKSTTPLLSWFRAMYLFTTTRNGVAAKEIERYTGVTYPTALRMAHQIKILMGKRIMPLLSGEVEADETYVGGKEGNKHANKKLQRGLTTISERRKSRVGRPGEDSPKATIIGAIQRNGQVVAKHVANATSANIHPFIKDNVKEGTKLYTDEWYAYTALNGLFKHETVKHMIKEYARGDVHTNTIESFWSQLKRMIKGTHIKVSDKHLQKYIDEAIFRYEHRKESNAMFEILISKITSDAA